MLTRNTRPEQNRAMWIGFTAVGLLWLGLVFGFFHWADSWLYDKLMSFPSIKQQKAPKVLLIETPLSYHYSESHDWHQVISKLAHLKPRAIVLPTRPDNWEIGKPRNYSPDIPLFFGELESKLSSPQVNSLKNNGVMLLPPIDGNSYRVHWYAPTILERSQFSLVGSVSRHLLKHEKENSPQSFYVDFRNGEGRMPVVKMSQLEKNGLVGSLVEGHVVLIGYVDPYSPDLLTPIGNISFPMFQAYALDTLLNENEIHHLGMLPMMLSILLAVALIFVLIPRISDRYQMLSFSLILIGTLTVSWLVLMSFEMWLRPGTIILTELTAFALLYFSRYEQHALHLRKMALNSSASIEHHWLQQSFYTTEEHWNHIGNMVSQTLALNRTIFLERVENEHKVKEIQSLNCNLDDIGEMRRDYHRAPYTDAIKKGGVIKLESQYLVSSSDNETQYLVPLNFAGEVQGFWAFSVKSEHPIDENKLLYSVDQFSAQISEMLFHRGHWLKHQAFKKNKMVRLISMKFDEPAYGTIYRSLNFFSQRLKVMEAVMDGMETSSILYDLFGRVLQVNKSMSSVLSAADLAPYSVTTVDLIKELTACDLTDARNYLSYIILDKGIVNLPVTNTQIKKGYMLSVRALYDKEHELDADGDVHPFEIIGILCELIDMSRLNDIYSQKEKVIEHLSGWLRSDLSSISVACDLAQDDRMDKEKRNKVVKMVKDKVTSLALSIERVNNIIQSDLVTEITAQYPIECKRPLLEVIEEAKKNLKKQLTINYQIPFYIPLVVASTAELKNIFQDLLNLLIIDAAEKTIITIEVDNRDSILDFNFSNQGFGLPNEQLQKYIQSDQLLDSDELKALRNINRQVTKWGGEFKATSSVGEGMHFSFKLESFKANE